MYLIGTGKQRSGKNGAVKVGATFLTHSKWNVVGKGEDLDTVNFESDGIDEGVLGVTSAEFTAGGNWDAGTNFLDNPPGLYPRDDLAALLFYTNITDATYWNFPYARLRSCTNGAEVRSLVTFEFSGMNQGPFSDPTGSI